MSNTRPTVVLPFANRQAYLGAAGDAKPGFDAEGYGHLSIGQDVDLEIYFKEEDVGFLARGVVLRRYETIGVPQRSGVRVDYSASDERSREIVTAYATGKEDDHPKRKARRRMIQTEVQATIDYELKPFVMRDMSNTGAFLLTDELINSGTLMALRLRSPVSGEEVLLNAEVIHRQSRPDRGVGIRFLIGSDEKQQQLEQLLRQLASIGSSTGSGEAPAK